MNIPTGNTVSPQIEKESVLKRLIEVKGVRSVYKTGADGFLLEYIGNEAHDPEGVAAISAFNLLSSRNIGQGLGLGSVQWVLMDYSDGKVVMAMSQKVIWTIMMVEYAALGEVLLIIDAMLKEHE